MDFEDILNKWEQQNSRNEVYIKDEEDSGGRSSLGERRSRLLRKKPDASIDLHGLTRDEAWLAMKTFFDDSKRKGFEKVLVIHGKGNHGIEPRVTGLDENQGVLKELVRSFIESCSYAGESGYSQAREGGRGSTWVILKPGK